MKRLLLALALCASSAHAANKQPLVFATGKQAETIQPGDTLVDGSGTPYSTGGGGSPGGLDTQIQYNNAGAFAGNAAMTFDGVNIALSPTGTIGLTSGGGAVITLDVDGDATMQAGSGANALLSSGGSSVLVTNDDLTISAVSIAQMTSSDGGTVNVTANVDLTTLAGSAVLLDAGGVSLADSAGTTFSMPADGSATLTAAGGNSLLQFNADGTGTLQVDSTLNIGSSSDVINITSGAQMVLTGATNGSPSTIVINGDGSIVLDANGTILTMDGDSPSFIVTSNGSQTFTANGVTWADCDADLGTLTFNNTGGGDTTLETGVGSTLFLKGQSAVAIQGNLNNDGSDISITNEGVSTGNVVLTSNSAIQLITVNVLPSPITNFNWSGSSGTFRGPTGHTGFYGEAGVAQAASITAPTGGAVVDTQARAAITSILTAIGKTSGIGITAN